MDKILFPVQAEYIKNFRNEKDALIVEMEEYAAEHNIPILSWDSAEFMEQILLLQEPKRVLEIGTAIAYSSIRIARKLKKKGIVHTIEKSPGNVEVAKKFIDKAGLNDKIKIYTGEAVDIMPELGKKYSFIFLDADKNDYEILFDHSLNLLKRGGLIFVDNLLWHGYAAAEKVPASFKTSSENIREFNNIFMNHPELKTSLLPIGDGIGLGIKL